MKARGIKIRNVGPVLWAGFTQDLERAPAGSALDPARDDLVRLLSRLTLDVERFDSMVHHERQRLQKHAATPDADDDDEFHHRSSRIRFDAARVAASARGALDELRRMSKVPGHAPIEEFESHQNPGVL